MLALISAELPHGSGRPFHVNSSKERPESAYAIFEYEGDWHWIDHDDLYSKRVFSLVLFLTTLTTQADVKDRLVLRSLAADRRQRERRDYWPFR